MIDVKYGQTLVYEAPEEKKEAEADKATEKAKRYTVLLGMSVFERDSGQNEELERLRAEIR